MGLTLQQIYELQKQGKVIVIQNDAPSNEQKSNELNQYEGMLQNLRKIKQPISGVPTFTPRSFYDQFQLYVNGSTRRLYIYMDKSWHYITMTA